MFVIFSCLTLVDFDLLQRLRAPLTCIDESLHSEEGFHVQHFDLLDQFIFRGMIAQHERNNPEESSCALHVDLEEVEYNL